MRASSLPAHFVAKPVQNAKTIDLSKLAANSVSEEVIVPGDVIEVAIAAGLGKEDSVELTTRVAEDGYAELPQIGRVRVSGQSLEVAESTISRTSVDRGVYRKPQVTVTMKQPKQVTVTVAGAVKKPGAYKLRPGSSDLLHALVSAGSITDAAGTNVEIRQPGQASIGETKAPLVASNNDAASGTQLVGYNPTIPPAAVQPAEFVNVSLTSLAGTSGDRYRLRDGAVVFVEERDPAPLSVGGLVKRPSRYPYPVGENLRLLDAINIAGGETSVVADKVYVIREVDAGGQWQRGVIQASIQNAKLNERENILLMPGDVVTVEKTAGTVFLDTLKEFGFNITGRAF